MTAMLREDYWIWDEFKTRQQARDVKKVYDRMIDELKKMIVDEKRDS